MYVIVTCEITCYIIIFKKDKNYNNKKKWHWCHKIIFRP